MSDLTATNCGCGCDGTSNNSIIWIILLLCCCGGWATTAMHLAETAACLSLIHI